MKVKILSSRIWENENIGVHVASANSVETVHITKGVLTLGKIALESNSQAQLGRSDTVQVILKQQPCQPVGTGKAPQPHLQSGRNHPVSILVVKSPPRDSILPETLARVDIRGCVVSEYHNPLYKVGGLCKLARHVVRRMNVSVDPWVCDEFVCRQGSRRAITQPQHLSTRLDACYDLSMHIFDSVKSFNYKTFRSIQTMSRHRPGVDDETALVALINSNATTANPSAPSHNKPAGSYISTKTLAKRKLSEQEEDRINRLMQAPFDPSTMMLLSIKGQDNKLREVRGVLIAGEDLQSCVSATLPSSQAHAIVWKTPYESVYLVQPLHSQVESSEPDSFPTDTRKGTRRDTQECTLGVTMSHIIQAAAAGYNRMPQTQYTAEHSHLRAFTPIQVLLSLSLNAAF